MPSLPDRPMNRIAICAPSTPFTREDAARVSALALAEFPALDLHFHDQCFASEGHFAGPDALRLRALLECANDPAFDAVWFARGGYGANRIAAEAVAGMTDAAQGKAFVGYSDGGTLLGALYRARSAIRFTRPCPPTSAAPGAKRRCAARWAGSRDRTRGWSPPGRSTRRGVQPDDPGDDRGHAADAGPGRACGDGGGSGGASLRGRPPAVPCDRLLAPMGIAGLRLGRVSDVPENDRPFGAEPEAMARYWCAKTASAFWGRPSSAMTSTTDRAVRACPRRATTLGRAPEHFETRRSGDRI
jgi:muramoyltetrapeptide carboxypeptidase